MAPDLSVIVPTRGRESLADTIASIPDLDWLEVVVVADGRAALARADDCPHPRGRIYETGPSLLGHPQRTLGMEKAEGRWLAFIDDDDYYTAAAFPAFRRAIRTRKRPVLFRMTYDYIDLTLWNEKAVAHCNVGSPMILTPNNPDRLGVWEPKRSGDYDFIRQTVEGFGGCSFNETVVCVVRRLDEVTAIPFDQ